MDLPFDFIVVAVFIVIFLAGFFILKHLHSTIRKYQFSGIPVYDSSKGHHWVPIEQFVAGVYCNICETSISHGCECDYCGLKVDEHCTKPANRKIKCKPCSSDDAVNRHHWVSGNLPADSVCTVCDEACGDGAGLCDSHCAWCLLSVHTLCKPSLSSVCDFGKHKRCIIPPNFVHLKLTGLKGWRGYIVDKVLLPPSLPDGWSPVIVIANRKSGNGEGDLVLRSFRHVLNPAQVLDLNDVPASIGLAWCTLLPVRCRILVAGGDGTIGWLLGALEDLAPSPMSPEVCLLPLGTGNDLSRVLGWGAGHSGEIDANKILERLSGARAVKLDRWRVAVDEKFEQKLLPRLRSVKRRINILRGQKGVEKQEQQELRRRRMLKISNYFSVGVDAMVTFNFDRRRRQLPNILSCSRLLNKLLFFHYGTRDVVERACRNLGDRLTLWLDGIEVPLPANLEGIVVLNIPSWGAGVLPWTLGDYSEDTTHQFNRQSIFDKRVEVFGIYSSFHIAQMQVGLAGPLRLGQANDVRIVLAKTGNGDELRVPMQADGEPWLQRGPATITVVHAGQATMLAERDAHVGLVGDDEEARTGGFFILNR